MPCEIELSSLSVTSIFWKAMSALRGHSPPTALAILIKAVQLSWALSDAPSGPSSFSSFMIDEFCVAHVWSFSRIGFTCGNKRHQYSASLPHKIILVKIRNENLRSLRTYAKGLSYFKC